MHHEAGTELKIKSVDVTADDIDEYRDRGYWITPKLLDDQQLDTLRREFDRFWVYDYDRDIYPCDRVYVYDLESPELRKVNNGWWLNNTVRAAVHSPELGRMAAALMGSTQALIWHDQVVCKPGVGVDGADYVEGNVGWHQDYAHWQVSSSQDMCTLWIALQDTDLSNGGMRTIVGSHHWGLSEDAETFHDKDLESLEKRYGAGREWLDEPCLLKAGQASVHHCLTFHGSGPNLSDDARQALIIHYMPEGTSYRGRVDPHKPILPGRKGNRHANVPMLGPNTAPGSPFTGEFFPRVWPID